MWCAVLRSVRASRVLAESKAAGTAILLRKREYQRISRLAACLYGRDSAIGSLLGVNQHLTTNEFLTPQAPGVAFNKDDQDSILKHSPDQPENPKVLKLAIIGAPNAGKSTLSNQLLGRKVFPVSCKVHTTRCKAQGILTEGDTQIILLDTPGMVNSVRAERHKLDKSFQTDPWESVKVADVVLVLVDVSDKWMRKSLHSEVLRCLSKNSHVTSILVLNKKYLMTLAKPGDWEYHSEVVTTQSPQEICNNIIREKLLEYLPQEIPYTVTQVTEFWEEGSGGQLVVKQTLYVAKENHVKLIIGPGGELISRIAKEAGRDLMNAFLCDVQLRLAVKYRKT
ncbi:hypothetical protein GDO81_006766 [Engystomops pustulosus]|uniref:GTPase Era, mitochondrial n=1 Tax=Engystomops pustulosus TaxID=76066 RepID=A0AAV7D193_ENGPU|nr:hypothetical protein GDO81_006766 [Engystomops pustulosus]